MAESVSLSPNLISYGVERVRWPKKLDRLHKRGRTTYRNRQGVVLVDDRDDSHVKQLGKGILGVDVLCSLESGQNSTRTTGDMAAYIGNIIAGQEYLGNWQTQM